MYTVLGVQEDYKGGSFIVTYSLTLDLPSINRDIGSVYPRTHIVGPSSLKDPNWDQGRLHSFIQSSQLLELCTNGCSMCIRLQRLQTLSKGIKWII